MQQAEILRNEALGATLVKKLKLRGFDAYYCADKQAALKPAATPEEKTELMRQALLCDTYLMSSNAISSDGQLVNIDGNGNRCAALIYGPKQVLVVAGLNKVTGSLEAAMDRARNVAAPINAKRFAGLQTPCYKAGLCGDCLSADCICSQIVITRTSRNKGRIKVILVGESLGF